MKEHLSRQILLNIYILVVIDDFLENLLLSIHFLSMLPVQQGSHFSHILQLSVICSSILSIVMM